MKLYFPYLGIPALLASSCFAGVSVSVPSNHSNVAQSVQYVATASTSCAKGVAAMGVYSAPNHLVYQVKGAALDTELTFSPGTYNTVVQEWDNCGGSTTDNLTITVGSGGGNGGNGGGTGAKTFANLHQQGGWTGYALEPPAYAICSSCKASGPQTTWSRWTGIKSPSLSGSSTQQNIGGKTRFSDVLWNNHLIGDFSSQGLPDQNHTLAPSLHNFTYDVYFYGNNIPASQALEFDINQFVDGKSFIWGHECRIAGGHEWDIWDNQAKTWHPTGVACNPLNNAWNHLTIQAQRTSGNQLIFQSITLNGKKATLNYYENPTSTGWYGITINYQQDGNLNQQAYPIWLDKLNFTYW
jgi:hypothetical protein